MDEEGRDGCGGGPWSYHEPTTGSSSYTIISSSSSSGTVSSAYTSSRSSHLSSISMEPTMPNHFACQEIDNKDHMVVTKGHMLDKKGHIKGLVQEFFGVTGGDIRVLGRWFMELKVGWVLRIADGASAGKLGHTPTYAARLWFRALTEIVETNRSLFLSSDSVGLPVPDSNAEGPREEERKNKTETIPDQLQFARFTQEAMSKMLAFVDVLVALNNPRTYSELFAANGVPASYRKLKILMDVRGAMSKALSEIPLTFHQPPSAEVERIQSEMVSLLSAKEGMVGEAIWSTMEEIRSHIPESMEDRIDTGGIRTPQGSSGLHKVTLSVTNRIKLLLGVDWSFMPGALLGIPYDATNLRKYYVPEIGKVAPWTSLVMDTVYCLEEKLANKSQSFLDQSFRFLFLLNNTHFIWQQLHPTRALEFYMPALTSKVEHYMESYLEASWAPVLSCLLIPTPPICFQRSNSLQIKFESEFQRIYATQKLWKVLDPVLRGRLRNAISERVVPAYREYLEDNNVTTPGITPKQLENMLQELFEG